MADSYFDPSFDLGPVCVYEAEGVLSDLSPVNSEKISLAAYPYMRKPEDFRLDVCYRNGMRPTAEDFRSFCHNAGCSVSHRNGNIADTLEALERYDRCLETLRHISEAAPHERDETRETRQQLQRLLDSAYDVRGHRSAGYWMIPSPRSAWRESGCPFPSGAFLKPALGCTCPVKSGPTPLTHMHGWIGIPGASSLAAARPETVKPSDSNRIRKRGPPFL